ncbi:unnamed protein product [Mesocestoides corti]|uniref:Glycerophosphocholine acyltransferase 1 n=1 Tax=Mesocestoides corti TaxID=53468 RepID=A0A0R3UEV0_MESCO|nr:unnamed protein product [Mesocestoides corti]
MIFRAISYTIRWFPSLSSVMWWTKFVDTKGDRRVATFNHMGDWIYMVVIPNAFFIAHTVLYFVIVHMIIKPDEKYNDNYRYLRSKYFLKWNAYQHLKPRVQIMLWMILNIVFNLLLTFVSCLAWCSFFFHSLMMIAMVIIMSWYGACYYLDYFAYLALRKAVQKPESPSINEVKESVKADDIEEGMDSDVEADDDMKRNLELSLQDSDSDFDV